MVQGLHLVVLAALAPAPRASAGDRIPPVVLRLAGIGTPIGGIGATELSKGTLRASCRRYSDRWRGHSDRGHRHTPRHHHVRHSVADERLESRPHGIGTPGMGTRTPQGITTPLGVGSAGHGTGTPGMGTPGVGTPIGGIGTPLGGGVHTCLGTYS